MPMTFDQELFFCAFSVLIIGIGWLCGSKAGGR